MESNIKMNFKKRIKSFLKSKKDLLISPDKKFKYIYSTNYWGDTESISGPGSKIAATENLRHELNILLKKFSIHSIIDAPCGDFNWMKMVDLNDINYLGVDIVKELVDNNNKYYSGKHKIFACINILEKILPKVDLILCRDCFPHLSNNNIYKALQNFINSESKYLLMSSYPENNINEDIVTGQWRKINFNLKPFNFPVPIYIIDEKSPLYLENGQNFDKRLYMWELSELKKYI